MWKIFIFCCIIVSSDCKIRGGRRATARPHKEAQSKHSKPLYCYTCKADQCSQDALEWKVDHPNGFYKGCRVQFKVDSEQFRTSDDSQVNAVDVKTRSIGEVKESEPNTVCRENTGDVICKCFEDKCNERIPKCTNWVQDPDIEDSFSCSEFDAFVEIKQSE